MLGVAGFVNLVQGDIDHHAQGDASQVQQGLYAVELQQLHGHILPCQGGRQQLGGGHQQGNSRGGEHQLAPKEDVPGATELRPGQARILIRQAAQDPPDAADGDPSEARGADAPALGQGIKAQGGENVSYYG